MNDKEIIDRCFDGLDPIDCEACPLHLENGGECCIGTYEPKNTACMACIHEAECIGQTNDRNSAARRAPSRAVSRTSLRIPGASRASATSRQPLARQPAPERTPVRALKHQNDRLLAPAEDYGYEPIDVAADAPFIKKFGLRAAWGAMEGALELSLDFFRTRRPR